jgi:integrase
VNTRDNFHASFNDHIYSVPSLPKLKVKDVVDEMRIVTAALGVPKENNNKTSSHSLRYGGATMMAAAGFPQYLVAQYGGWSEKSKSMQLYTKLPVSVMSKVSSHMVSLASSNVSEAFIQDNLALMKAYKKK